MSVNVTFQSENISQELLYTTDGITTRRTTPELTTTLITTVSDTVPDTISNSTTGTRDDLGKVDGAVIGGAVCGAVVALVLIVLIVVIVHQRTKSRFKKRNISQKSPPPVYDYAYGNCPEGNQTNLQSEDKNTESKQTKLSQIVIDYPDSKTPVSDLGDPPTQTIENKECGPPVLDSSGYLLLDGPGNQTAHHGEVGDTYDYAYSDKHKRHSADDYVNTRVSSVDVTENTANSRQSTGNYVNSRVVSEIERENAEYSLAKDPEVKPEDQSTEELYEIPEPIVMENPDDIVNKQPDVPAVEFSLAKQPLPIINTAQDTRKSNISNTNVLKEYSLAKVPEKDSSPIPKRPEKRQVTESTEKQGNAEIPLDELKDNHIYQNTQVKQLIAKLNYSSSSENLMGVKQKDELKPGKKLRNDVTKSANINRELLQLGVPHLKTSHSETQLDKKSNMKPKKALMPPINRFKKSASTDALS